MAAPFRWPPDGMVEEHRTTEVERRARREPGTDYGPERKKPNRSVKEVDLPDDTKCFGCGEIIRDGEYVFTTLRFARHAICPQ